MVALPLDTAVTRPFLSTVAISGLLEDQLTLLLKEPVPLTVTVRLLVSFTLRLNWWGLTFTLVIVGYGLEIVMLEVSCLPLSCWI